MLWYYLYSEMKSFVDFYTSHLTIHLIKKIVKICKQISHT
jgi:hypothetical protein